MHTQSACTYAHTCTEVVSLSPAAWWWGEGWIGLVQSFGSVWIHLDLVAGQSHAKTGLWNVHPSDRTGGSLGSRGCQSHWYKSTEVQPRDEELDWGSGAVQNSLVPLSSIHVLNVSFDCNKDEEPLIAPGNTCCSNKYMWNVIQVLCYSTTDEIIQNITQVCSQATCALALDALLDHGNGALGLRLSSRNGLIFELNWSTSSCHTLLDINERGVPWSEETAHPGP